MIALMLELKKRDMVFKYDTMSDELQLVIPSGAGRTSTWSIKKGYTGYTAVGVNYTKITAEGPVDLINAINTWHKEIKAAVAPLRAMETLASSLKDERDRVSWKLLCFPDKEIETSSDPELYFMYGLGLKEHPDLLDDIIAEFFKIMNKAYKKNGLVIAEHTFKEAKGRD